MATLLDKALRRQLSVDGVDFMVVLDPEGIRLTQKGKRRPEVELRWREILSGEAAMAVALNASLTARPAAVRPAPSVASGPAPVVPARAAVARVDERAPAPKKRVAQKPR